LSEEKRERGSTTQRSGAAGKTPETRRENPLVLLARYSEIGFLIPAAVIVGYFFGLLADHLLHTHWLYLVGIIYGAVAGFVSMIRQALQSGEEAAAEDQARGAEAAKGEETKEDGSDDER
jgi:F0F1-type ATP synthase assembly protein I